MIIKTKARQPEVLPVKAEMKIELDGSMTHHIEAGVLPTAPARREPFKAGVYEGVSNKEYHADPALGSTSLKTLALRTPAHWKWESEHPVHKDAYGLGTVTHSVILEGDDSGVTVIDVTDKRGAKWSVPADEAKTAGKIPLTTAEWETVEGMRYAVMAHPLAAKAFTGHRAEVSVFWEEDGQMFKCRPDAWKPGLIVDLKTARDADPNQFGKSAFDYGYFMSAPHYIDGVKAATGEDVKFVFVNVEKTAPYLVSVVELTEADMSRGRYQLERAKRIHKECATSNHWPGYPEFSTVELPRYKQFDLDEMEASNE